MPPFAKQRSLQDPLPAHTARGRGNTDTDPVSRFIGWRRNVDHVDPDHRLRRLGTASCLRRLRRHGPDQTQQQMICGLMIIELPGLLT